MNQFAMDSAVDDSEFAFGYINEVGKPTARDGRIWYAHWCERGYRRRYIFGKHGSEGSGEYLPDVSMYLWFNVDPGANENKQNKSMYGPC